MDQEELLGEVEDILRTMPPRETLRHPTDENFAWLGRVSAVIEAWDLSKSIPLGMAMHQFQGTMARDAQEGMRTILTLLHQARHDLRMKTIGPVNVAMGQGRVLTTLMKSGRYWNLRSKTYSSWIHTSMQSLSRAIYRTSR